MMIGSYLLNIHISIRTKLASANGYVSHLLKAQVLFLFETYIRNNTDFIPNYGERYRYGETISTAFVESTINQVVSRRMVKKQQMYRRCPPAAPGSNPHSQ
jgi:hypothetical protein